MSILLYDLAGADPALRFSPYCWRARLALAHKGLPTQTLPWRFTEGERIAFSGSEKVPVIVDDGRAVADSWAIAVYLEHTRADRPSLFSGAGGMAHARFINAWADSVMNPAIARLILHDIWTVLDPGDQEYFRASREARFGMRLEQVQQDREARREDFRRSLSPLRAVLAAQPWFGGDAPSYADYILFSGFQWARCASRFALLAEDDPIAEWRGRMLGLFDGLAAAAAVA
ncbi:MAG: glutathione S-transferase family protein [Acidisphaera sp.]|nr:glutathione S-transferase family protein [Acidisphaera sp.]